MPIEYYDRKDKETKRPFDPSVLNGLSLEEQADYLRNNVYYVVKSYRVFNCDLIEGIPAQETNSNEENISTRAENLISYWDEHEAKIVHGGNQSYYAPTTDEIHIPERGHFFSLEGYYSTLFHEIGHSTGHETRLNRSIKNTFGTPAYAEEELRAEIASMFLEQELHITVKETDLHNNVAYLKNWHDSIKENPDVLFNAIAAADQIASFILAKETEALC